MSSTYTSKQIRKSPEAFVRMLIELIDYAIEKQFANMGSDTESKVCFMFDGEFDSNQSEFELKSNQLEVGVVTTDVKVGYFSLAMLRGIIGDHNNYYRIANVFENFSPKEKVSVKKIFKLLSNSDLYPYASICAPNKIKRTLYSSENGKRIEHKIRKNPADVDIWDIYRIKAFIVELSEDVQDGETKYCTQLHY